MSVQTFNPTDLSQSAANWAVAQRIVGPFAPHAQVSPDLTVALDPGHLLNSATLTEVKAQVVGPFAPPASGFRIDRVVVDRSSGAASIVAGTANSLSLPAIPSGKLPVARVFLENTTQAIGNDAIVDERALFDLTPPTNSNVIFRATLGGTDQTGVANATYTRVSLSAIEFNIGSGFDAANRWFKPSIAGYYAFTGQISVAMNTGATLVACLYKNGSAYTKSKVVSGGNYPNTGLVSDIIYLNGTTDYVELYGYQNNGASASFTGGSEATYLTAQRIA